MKKKLKILILILLILISIISVFFNIKNHSTKKIVDPPRTPPPNLPRTSGEEEGGGLITLEINNEKYQSQNEEGISIAGFMKKLKSEGKISFTEKNYTGMGKFIESINGIKNGEKNWIYYVNGKKANIGISNYKINSGDVVSWKYEKGY
jgi:hypothetical protein